MFLTILLTLASFTSDFFIVDTILISGNKQTRPHIILQEMTFSPGDSVQEESLPDIIGQNKKLIYNTGLFSVVEITYKLIPEKLISVEISVKERWYIWPYPVFYFYTFDDENSSVNSTAQALRKERIVYGADLGINNFRGKNEKVSFGFLSGFIQSYSLSYSTPRSLWKRTVGISFSLNYDNLRSMIYSDKNGIANRVALKNNYIRKNIEAHLSILKKWDPFNSSSVEFYYNDISVHKIIPFLNSGFFSSGTGQEKYPSLYFNHVINRRDYYDYPLQGYYLHFFAGKIGFPGSNPDLFKWKITFAKYIHISGRWYFASGFRFGGVYGNKISFPLRFFWGTMEYLRGYEKYFSDGRWYLVNQTELRYELFKRKDIHIKRIPLKQFRDFPVAMYLSVFSDRGYISDAYPLFPNPVKNRFFSGFGIGYNLLAGYGNVLRVEYSGNQFGQWGLYLHGTRPF